MPHDDVANDTGKVLPTLRVALYRDPGGELHALSSVCTHMACDVGWNDQEKVWDCPCHGSRFSPAGDVIRGPAARPLPKVGVPG
jgi:Rieske Fe-S protein